MTKKDFLGGNDNDNSVDYYFRTKRGAEKERVRLRKQHGSYFMGRKMTITKVRLEDMLNYGYQLRVYEKRGK
jgi:hypothetical protein